MMTASPVSQAHASSKYYEAEGYYKAGSDEAKDAATWFGDGAAKLGFKDTIDEKAFATILQGDHPGGTSLRREKEGQNTHRAGVDMTFSAPKSVSIMALVGGDDRLIGAHDKAVKTALTWVEANAFNTRRYDENRQPIVEKATGMIAGVYRHDLSRALDPQLHSHAVVANMAQSPDGKMRAVHNTAMFDNARLITAIYRAELTAQMRKIGYQVREGRHGAPEIEGISQKAMDQFSKRSAQVAEMLDGRNLDHSPQTARLATLLTRARKNKEVDRAEVYAAHKDEARSVGLTPHRFDRIQPGAVHEAAPDRFSALWEPASGDLAVMRAAEHLSENNSVFKLNELRASALRFGQGIGIGEVDGAIANHLDKGALLRDGERMTTRDTVASERLMLGVFRDASAREAPVNGDEIIRYQGEKRAVHTIVGRKLERTTLTDGQKDAVRLGLTSTDRIVGVQGYAGTGKTFMLKTLNDYAKTLGQSIEGLAPSHRAVEELSAVAPGARTVQAAIMRPAQSGEGRGKILAVDEASMLSTKDMTALLSHAETAQYDRVILIGDIQQLDAVAAGAAFKQLQKNGLNVAVMDDIQRQRNAAALSTVNHAIAGEVKAAFDKVGEVTQSETIANEVARQYLALSPNDREKAGMAALSQHMRADVNAAVRDGLRAEGKLGPDIEQRTTLRNLNFTTAEKRDIQSYSVGDIIVSHKDLKSAGIVRNARYSVEAVDPDTARLTLARDGQSNPLTLPVTPQSRSIPALSIYREEGLTLAKNDAVRIGSSDLEAGIKTGDRAKIIDVSDQTISLKKADGARVELPKDRLAANTLTHAYASTVHDLQGATMDRIIAAMPANSPLATQKAFYVAVSRVRDTASIVTDDRARLIDAIERHTGARASALDHFETHSKDHQKDRDGLEIRRTERDAIRDMAKDIEDQKTDPHALKTDEIKQRIATRQKAMDAMDGNGEAKTRDGQLREARDILTAYREETGGREDLRDLEQSLNEHIKDRGHEL